jgi:hypothetical protein
MVGVDVASDLASVTRPSSFWAVKRCMQGFDFQARRVWCRHVVRLGVR